MTAAGPTPKRGRAKRLTRRQFVARSVLGVGALAVGGGVWEANSIEVTRHRRILPGLPVGRTAIRIAQLSDLHRGPLVSEGMVDRAVALANAEKPDIVLLTGDFVSWRARYADSCVSALRALRPKRGVWAVLGNHEYWTGEPRRVEAALRRAGYEVLVNASRRLDEGLYLVGLDDHTAGRPDAGRALAQVPAGAAIIAMSHNPLDFEQLAQRPCVSFSGHTHGGQITFYGRAWYVMTRYGYVSGWYRRGEASLYVNRGVGVVMVPLRYGARPEVTIVDLVPA